MKIIFDGETEGSVQDTINLVAWDFLEKQLGFVLPEGFSEMSEEKREESYPLSNRPQIILEDEQRKVQITIHFFHKTMKKEDITGAVEQILELTRKAFAQYEYSPIYLFTDGAVPVGWFLMRMKDIEKEHIKAVLPIKESMVLLTLTYPEEESIKWCSFKDYMFASIKEDSNGTGNI